MTRTTYLAASLASVLFVMTGCSQNPYMLQRQVQAEQQQKLAITQQSQELQKQIEVLDNDNKELQTLLAQSRQQTQVMQEQLTAMREQLSGTAGQMARLQEEHQATEKRTEALVASTRRRASASITANNSFQDTLPTFSQPGVLARRDGDVIRIELPADALFEPNTAQLRVAASRTIEDVADELARNYPGHFIGVEGHTDADPSQPAAASNHQLSAARAAAVLEQLSTRTRLRPNQLFVAGRRGV